MRYHVLATDYDATLAAQGSVDAAPLDGLKQVRMSGRKPILVTGRVLGDQIPRQLYVNVCYHEYPCGYREGTLDVACATG